jgi:hypothetical protein
MYFAFNFNKVSSILKNRLLWHSFLQTNTENRGDKLEKKINKDTYFNRGNYNSPRLLTSSSLM